MDNAACRYHARVSCPPASSSLAFRSARVPPSGPGWLHEIKHDGYRLMARLEDSRVRLFSRRGHDWSDRFPRIHEALASQRARSETMDGEAVVLCPKTGLFLFDELHSGRRDHDVILCAFDLLELDGTHLRPLPLVDRKARLSKLLAPVAGGIELNEHLEADGATIFRHACKLGCEGIVSKQRASSYRSGRVRTWIKTKNPDSPAMARVWER